MTRRDLAMRACDGCACRPGTWARLDESTQDDLEDAGARFLCHQLTEDGPMARCAGAVARWGTDTEVAEMLANPPTLITRWCAVGEAGVCGHHHETPESAAECARGLPDAKATVAKALHFDDFIIPPENVRASLAPYGLRWPAYWHVVGHAGRCLHCHWTPATALRCLIEDDPLSGRVRRHDTWPVRTDDEGVECDETALWASSDSLETLAAECGTNPD